MCVVRQRRERRRRSIMIMTVVEFGMRLCHQRRGFQKGDRDGKKYLYLQISRLKSIMGSKLIH